MASAQSAWKSYVDFMVSKGNIENLLIVDSENGNLWATSSEENFQLREYTTTIAQEDGSDKDEMVNEASNLIKFIKGEKPSQGLRLNKVKQQITRTFKDDDTGLVTIYGKVSGGGSAIVHAGKCVLVATFAESKNHTSNGCNEVLRLMGVYLFKSTWPDSQKSGGGSGGGNGNSGDWKAYIDQLMSSNNVAVAAILNKETGAILAKSNDFNVGVICMSVICDNNVLMLY